MCVCVQVAPSFCKQYAQVGHAVERALRQYCEEVAAGTFPSAEYSPYKARAGAVGRGPRAGSTHAPSRMTHSPARRRAQMSDRQAALFAEEVAGGGEPGGDATAEAGEADEAGAGPGEGESPYGKAE